MKNELPDNQLKDTLRNIEEALTEWNQIPDGAESEMDRFRKKTQELLKKLNEQIKALGL